jgi:hypothetical protein
MPTIIGVIFFCAGAYCFLRKEDGLLGMLIIASVFEASSALNVAERGIQPHYVIATFIIARALLNGVLGFRPGGPMPQGKWLLIFGAVAIFATLVFPFVFAGTPIYDPKLGIDEPTRPPLQFGLNNVAQAVFVAWHIAAAYAVLHIRYSAKTTRRVYIFAFYLALAFVFAQSFCSLTGLPYPDSVFRNNPGYGIVELEKISHGVRCPGTFTEPSIAGAFIAMYGVSFLAEYLTGKGGVFRVVIALLGVGLIASSGALLSLAICFVILAICYSPFRLPWYINIRQARRIVGISFLIVAPVILLLAVSAGYRDTLLMLTVSKGETGSFLNRTASDLYGLQLFVQTYGLGLGLGSNRSSSLFTTLLSCVGLIGTFSFGMFYSNMIIDISDVTFPLLWLPILLAIQFSQDGAASRQKLNYGDRVQFVEG